MAIWLLIKCSHSVQFLYTNGRGRRNRVICETHLPRTEQESARSMNTGRSFLVDQIDREEGTALEYTFLNCKRKERTAKARVVPSGYASFTAQGRGDPETRAFLVWR
jgi:hypothetical protein